MMTNPNNKYCGQCGHSNPMAHNFCSSCGVKFEGTNAIIEKKYNGKNLSNNRKTAIAGVVTGAAAGYMGARLAQTVDKLSSENNSPLDEHANEGIASYASAIQDENNVVDAVVLDIDDDSIADAIIIDNDGDGIIDAIVMDVDNDGVIDAITLDHDNDGIVDEIIIDSDFDGKPDTSYTIEENNLDKGTEWDDFF